MRLFTYEMNTAESQQLLAEYVQTGSEAAFRSLVECYLGLVYAAACRLVGGDTHRAEDVTQIVFADLARKARALSREPMLGGWLHRHTCYVASTLMRSERRRQLRERQAMEMNLQENDSESNLARVAPIIDEVINQLEPTDRYVILLRFFERKDFRALGEAVGIKEDAARMRVNRALEKLHGLLGQRGVSVPVTVLASLIAAETLTAAPAGLAIGITGAALSSAAGAGGTALTLLHAMGITKLKFVTVSILAVAAITTPLVVQHQSKVRLVTENRLLREQLAQGDTLIEENQRLSNLVAQASKQLDQDRDQMRELLRLRAEVTRLRSDSLELAKLRQNLRAQARVAETTEHKVVSSGPNPILYTRIINVDPAVFTLNLEDPVITGAGNTNSDAAYQAALRKFLSDRGIEIEPPAAVYMDQTNGTLRVRTSLENLDKVEKLLSEMSDQK
ncbi:MAG TPA: sigma-70 family RNA polymerase sigma factor, partial [Clostridia bacterium]|nr:sigma-70 family RNA polymerase sigma factor [Clostridia bacterium]